MASLPFPDSGTLGELGLIEGHQKPKAKVPPRKKPEPPDEDYEREMAAVTDDMLGEEPDEEEDEDAPPPPMRKPPRRHMTKGRPAQEVYKNGKKVEIHTEKWHRCVDKVKARGGGYNEYAVCTASLGREGSIKAKHRSK